jgi:MFS family permease
MTTNEASTHARTPADLAARLDRLPWSGLHATILVALGSGWLFDSLEVQLFGSAVGPLGAHFHASVFAQDAILAVWLTGILLGALAGGHLADRFGRRRLFLVTLLWYAGFTVLTGLSPALGFVYGFRFLAALGVGAEYAIVNAAIAELMPARVRGRVGAVVMNFWAAGAVLAGLLAYLLLDTLALDDAVSWRYLFVIGGVLALVVLYFRRRIPESPRWLASQGRYEEAAEIVVRMEERSGLVHATGHGTPETGHGISDAPPVPTPAPHRALGELLRRHPGRLALGSVLDLAEAFGYYGIFALLSVVVLKQVRIGHAQVPFFFIVGNVGALVGGLAMSLVLDRLGRHRTVAVCYTLAAAGVGLLAWATASGSALWVMLAFISASAFANAAWTSAYPTFTELFPTHLRGAGVGFSVAVGRIGAIVGTLVLPDLATRLGATASYLLVVACWLAGVAAIGIFRLRGGIDAASRPLESLTPTPA